MNAVHEETRRNGISTFAGPLSEIRSELDLLKAEQVVAIALEHASPSEANALASTLASLAYVVREKLTQQDREVLESIVEALVPKAPPKPTLLKEAAMLARSRKAVLEGADWLTAPEIARLAGFSESNPSAQPNKWKREGIIFAIRHNGVDYFPGYGLDAETGYRPIKALARVIRAFEGMKDGWGLAYWFLSANSFLGGKRPQDLLARQPERVLAAAQDEREGVLHG